jgi:predicted Zn-dependent peptidase
MKHTVTEHQLNSGAKGLLVDVPGSGVVNILIRFNSGFQFGDMNYYELPHVLEHLIAVGGTPTYPNPSQFATEMEKNGASFNANTSSRFNGYIVTCAEFELDRILGLVDEWLTAPLLPETAFATEVGNVREELTRNTTSYGNVSALAFLEKVYPGKNLNSDTRIEQLPGITIDMARNHYKATHTAQNARFYLSGAVGEHSEAILAKLDALFAKLPAGERAQPDFGPGLGVAEPILVQKDIKQLYYNFGIFNAGVDDNRDFALNRLGSVLFGGWNSRVFGEARRRGIAYSVSGGGEGDAYSSSFEVGGNVSEANALELMKLVADQMKAVAAGDLTAEELEAAKERVIGHRAISHQTPGSLGNYYLGLYDTEERVRPYDGELAQIRATTTAEVTEAARFMLSSNQWAVSWLGDLDEAKAELYTQPLREIFK